MTQEFAVSEDVMRLLASFDYDKRDDEQGAHMWIEGPIGAKLLAELHAHKETYLLHQKLKETLSERPTLLDAQ